MEMIQALTEEFENYGYSVVDASHEVTGKDFLTKIWKMTLSVPVGMAVLDNTMSLQTVANIFYELGLLHALGKETILVKSKTFKPPSDFVRTEYISYDRKGFKNETAKFFQQLDKQAEYYSTMGEILQSKPLVAFDYYRGAYLLTGNRSYQDQASELAKKMNPDEHTEMMIQSLLKCVS